MGMQRKDTIPILGGQNTREGIKGKVVFDLGPEDRKTLHRGTRRRRFCQVDEMSKVKSVWGTGQVMEQFMFWKTFYDSCLYSPQ